jgi:hypothetical protein
MDVKKDELYKEPKKRSLIDSGVMWRKRVKRRLDLVLVILMESKGMPRK